MNKSFIERIFPHSPNSVLPRYEDNTPPRASTSSSPSRIQLRDSASSPDRRSESPKSLKSAPLSASIVHHEDPFLPVERAAKALQRTIQSYLDAQSEGLNASLTGNGSDDVSSVGSPTPTPSAATPSRATIKTIPVRQPSQTRISLRGARRGLVQAMEEFAQLKDEELNIVDTESLSRQNALKRSTRFQEKRNKLTQEMTAVQSDESASTEVSLRTEAGKVEAEIQGLENRLFELKARHRHLINQADQFTNTMESKLSSYKSSLALVEKDVRQFLRHPPVAHSLPSNHGGMYGLRPERRTLDMALDQWTSEQELLSNRKADVESEREALYEGVKIWREASKRISEFERSLRRALKDPSASSGSQELSSPEDRHSALLEQLNDLISSLHEDLSTAESKSWNLLICCLGAEIEALEQGRLLLGGAPEPTPADGVNGTASNHDSILPHESASNPTEDLLNGAEPSSPGAASNHSLEDTLREFSDPANANGKGKEPIRPGIDSDNIDQEFTTPPPRRPSTRSPRDESEDDDPGPDFLLSHS